MAWDAAADVCSTLTLAHLCPCTVQLAYSAVLCVPAAAVFWADFATHLATTPELPFIPTDPTGVAASTAAITAALAVVGLPCEGAAGAADCGCSRSYAGSTLTLTAMSACLLWVKQVKAVAGISATAAAAQAAAAGSSSTGAPASISSSASASTVMVAERLYDPRFAAVTDPETGEQLLLSLQPSEQQPLLAGQSYCHSVVITSTGPSEQQLDILLQVGLAKCRNSQSHGLFVGVVCCLFSGCMQLNMLKFNNRHGD